MHADFLVTFLEIGFMMTSGQFLSSEFRGQALRASGECIWQNLDGTAAIQIRVLGPAGFAPSSIAQLSLVHAAIMRGDRF